MKLNSKIYYSLLVVLTITACVTSVQLPTEQESIATIKESFVEKGIVKLGRLDQSALQKTCSEYAMKELPTELKSKLEKEAMTEIKYPLNGKYLGDWKEGEKIAQNGRGLQFSDDEKTVNGGNCYACHQISKKEISFGNIGPSLAEYGKLRGGPSEALLKYTWEKIYNSHSYNACSVMPRYGASAILNEKQIQDVMALLLDPKSAINNE
jgi:L-cysteine S-thiosulfotransferase